MDTEKFDRLAHDACTYVFDFMIKEPVAFVRDSHLIGEEAAGSNIFATMKGIDSGFYSVSVGYVGDAKGMIILILTRALAEGFTCKLLGVPNLEWLGAGEARETMRDTLGELANSYVGLVKGALTQFYPHLMLTTPSVVQGSLIPVNPDDYTFRKQYLFTAIGSSLIVDICHK